MPPVLIPATKNRNMRIPEAAKASHMNQKIENFIIVGVTWVASAA